MEKSIEGKINSGGSVDVEYWETLLRKLKVQKAKAKLREFHSQLLRGHLDALEDAERKDTFGRDRELRLCTFARSALARCGAAISPADKLLPGQARGRGSGVGGGCRERSRVEC